MKAKQLLILLFLSGFIFGLLFKLKWFYLLFILFFYAFIIRRIQSYQRIQDDDYQRFLQVNSYMSQISQSFVRTKNILSSLQETVLTFPPGKMHTLLLEAIDVLLLEGGDITVAEKKALHRLEEEYPCERLFLLHEFMLLVESQGGDCKREFVLLEKMRLAWENALRKYYGNLLETRNLTTLLYGLMLGVCTFVLHAFPDDLSIVHLEFIQITNFIMTLLLIVIYMVLDKQICGQLFRKPKVLTQKKEMAVAFPKWLFNLMLLMQRESVESAILHSIPTAPPVLLPEVQKMSELMLAHPGEISVFTSFLADYNLPQVELNMQKLYALSIGADKQEDSIRFMIESNMDDLMKAEEKSYEQRGGLASLIQFLPILITSIGMLLYCVAIIIVSLSHISALFQ